MEQKNYVWFKRLIAWGLVFALFLGFAVGVILTNAKRLWKAPIEKEKA